MGDFFYNNDVSRTLEYNIETCYAYLYHFFLLYHYIVLLIYAWTFNNSYVMYI